MNDILPEILVEKIISGGQTGADRAALDWAIANGLPYGGFCPKDRLAEDWLIPTRYHLEELDSPEYAVRTTRNVEKADVTVVFTLSPDLRGEAKVATSTAAALAKPCLHLSAAGSVAVAAGLLRSFVHEHHVQVLNVTGSWESSEPEIAAFVRAVLNVGLKQEPRQQGAAFLGN